MRRPDDTPVVQAVFKYGRIRHWSQMVTPCEEQRIVIYFAQKGIVPLFEELLPRSVTSGEAVAKVTIIESFLKSCMLADPDIVPVPANNFGV